MYTRAKPEFSFTYIPRSPLILHFLGRSHPTKAHPTLKFHVGALGAEQIAFENWSPIATWDIDIYFTRVKYMLFPRKSYRMLQNYKIAFVMDFARFLSK